MRPAFGQAEIKTFEALSNIGKEPRLGKFSICDRIDAAFNLLEYAVRLVVESRTTRKRNPIKPATAVGYQSYVDHWLIPNIGDMPLSQVDNKTVKGLVAKLAEAKLAPKTIVDIVAVAKMVVASARDDNGKRLYPREWNHEFIDLPVVKSKDQDTPTVEAGEISDILSKASGRYRVL